MILLLLSNYCIGQKVTYDHSDTISIAKNSLYSNAKLWLLTTTNKPVDIDDSIQLTGNSSFIFKFNSGLKNNICRCVYSIRIDLGENKYKIQFYNIFISFSPGYETPIEELKAKFGKEIYKKITGQIGRKMLAMIDDFTHAINKPNSL